MNLPLHPLHLSAYYCTWWATKIQNRCSQGQKPCCCPTVLFPLEKAIKKLKQLSTFLRSFSALLDPCGHDERGASPWPNTVKILKYLLCCTFKKVLQRWQRSALLPLFLCSRLLPLFSPRFHLPSCSVSLSLSSSIMDEAHWSQCDSLWKIPNISRKGWHVIANASGHVSTDHLCKTYSFCNFFPLIMHLTFHPFI